MIDSIKFGLLNANSVKIFNDPVRNLELIKICKLHEQLHMMIVLYMHPYFF